MSKKAIFWVLAVCGLVFGMLALSYMSAVNKGIAFESGIKATWENNENLLAQYGQKVMEAAQVTEMARDDITKVVRDAVQGRYGQEGSKALFQAITEQNPSVDPALYRTIQQIIEGGRTEFQQGQTRLIDQKRAYELALGQLPVGFLLRWAGFPKLNLAEYKAITTERASKAFDTGKEAPLQLRAQP